MGSSSGGADEGRGSAWALRIIWELSGDGRLTVRERQNRCGSVSASVLAQRVKELREAGFIAADGTGAGYALTEEGRLLLEAYSPYPSAERWAARSAAAGSPVSG